MPHTRGLLRIALHGMLAVWMAAVAVAPLWHTSHAAPATREDAPGHDHHAGAWMCDATPGSVEPGVDCVLCKAQRQLSQYRSRVPGISATLQAAATLASPAPFPQRAGERISLPSRAPPRC
jgi:hypothetical protein